VSGLKVVPITTTSVRVEWDTVEKIYWSGDHKTGGYRVEYRSEKFPTAVQATPKEDVMGIEVSSWLYHCVQTVSQSATGTRHKQK
jgi:protein sidekick